MSIFAVISRKNLVRFLFKPYFLKLFLGTKARICKPSLYKALGICVINLDTLTLKIRAVCILWRIIRKTCSLVKFYVKISQNINNSLNCTFYLTLLIRIFYS